jgi:hypothetical protein
MLPHIVRRIAKRVPHSREDELRAQLLCPGRVLLMRVIEGAC